MSERTQVRDVSRHRGVARIRRSARLPNFIVIGAMKSGTMSLFHDLQAHPQAHMSPRKEVEFFVEEKTGDAASIATGRGSPAGVRDDRDR